MKCEKSPKVMSLAENKSIKKQGRGLRGICLRFRLSAVLLFVSVYFLLLSRRQGGGQRGVGLHLFIYTSLMGEKD